jgi:helix-turn-helix protein
MSEKLKISKDLQSGKTFDELKKSFFEIMEKANWKSENLADNEKSIVVEILKEGISINKKDQLYEQK